MTDEVKPDLSARKGWQWADGKMHDTPPPSSEAMVPSPVLPLLPAEQTAPIAKRAEVPADFKPPSARYCAPRRWTSHCAPLLYSEEGARAKKSSWLPKRLNVG